MLQEYCASSHACRQLPLPPRPATYPTCQPMCPQTVAFSMPLTLLDVQALGRQLAVRPHSGQQAGLDGAAGCAWLPAGRDECRAAAVAGAGRGRHLGEVISSF